jgi:hypothetical protein
MIVGISETLVLFVACWVIRRPIELFHPHILEEEAAGYGWMMLTAMELSPPLRTVGILHGDYITAATMKTQE